MNRTFCAFTAVTLSLSLSAELASARQSGTAAEAKAMLERAAAALKANEAAALNEFNDKHDRRFHDRDLYVFCNTLSDGKMTAHPKPISDREGFPRHHWRYAYAKNQRRS